ncbi:unnamed protein product [Eruca vesicaria subsp. sativa]|uniref:UBC core domain-containing protein n=1 Tax=Eruca vesicaria subsp. sativa TaxID=29727 RepID=A0ABC8KAZ0_ERUVS|nr:unnamed protein product [Eruca vesicaria subsp. sativa]
MLRGALHSKDMLLRVKISPNYPDPPPYAPTTTATTDDPTTAFPVQHKQLSADLV